MNTNQTMLNNNENKNNNEEKKKYKKAKIPATVKNIIWKKYMGNGIEGLCPCCKTEIISALNFHAGHIIPECQGGPTTVDNLIPLCPLCNTSMARRDYYSFTEKWNLAKLSKDHSIGEPIPEEYYIADHYRRMSKRSMFVPFTDKIGEYWHDKNLDNLSKPQLIQLCYMNDLPISGTVQKLIGKLSNCKINTTEIPKTKYFIVCRGDLKKRCDNCKYEKNIDFTVQCDSCFNGHTYFTNTDLTNNKKWDSEKITIQSEDGMICEVCKVPRYMKIFYNKFI